jgi:hypothetical protein
VLAALALALRLSAGLFAAISSIAASILLAASFPLIAALRTLGALFHAFGRALAILRRRGGRRDRLFSRLIVTSDCVGGLGPG